MKMRFFSPRILVAILLVSMVLDQVAAVDRSKFKRCDQSGFCKRNRELATSPLMANLPSPYTLSFDGKDVQQSLANSKFTAFIADTLDLETPMEDQNSRFVLEVISYTHDIVRVRIFEKEPLVPRYQPTDVLLPDLESKQRPIKGVSTSVNDSISLDLGNGKELRITKPGTPLAFAFYDNNELAISINDRSLLSFEHTRPRPGHEQQRHLLENKEGEAEAEAGSEEDEVLPGEEEQEHFEDEPEVSYNEKGERIDHGKVKQEKPAEDPNENKDEAAHVRELLEVTKELKFKRVNSEDHGWEETFGSHRDPKRHGPQSVGADFTFHNTRHLFGIPEHASSLALKDTHNQYHDPYRLYNLDVFEYELDNPMALYGAVPFVISLNEKGSTGLFWFNPSETWIDVNKENPKNKGTIETHWMSESGIIDFFVFFGKEPSDISVSYALVTGTQQLPPIAALAYHQCRWNYKDQADVATVDAHFDEYDIPYDFIWLDIEHTDGKRYFTWDDRFFPDPMQMINSVASKGRKMVTIIDPHLKRDSNYHIHSEAERNKYYVRHNAHDDKDYEGWCWPGSSSWLDYLNPVVRTYWADKFLFSSYIGSTPALYTWNDMNEPSVFNGPEVTMAKDAYHFGGFEHRDVHNVYGFYMHMATYEGHLRRSNYAERPFVLTRSFFSGSQRYAAVWTGDNMAQWSHLKIAQPMLLSLSIGGIQFCGADVGGFFHDTPPELMARWYQAGAFHPFFRAHAHLETKRREPWLFGEQWTGYFRQAIRTRYTLLPYWYTLFHEAHTTGVPIMRPLWYEFPKDVETYDVDEEFFVGKSLLVVPVTSEGATTADVFFPGVKEDRYYDFFDYTLHFGGRREQVEAPISKIPVFIRGGTILPKKERARRSSTQMKNDPFTLVVALSADKTAEGSIYLDDGHSFEYVNKEAFIKVGLKFENNQLSLSVLHHSKDSSFTVSNTVERIVVLGLNKTPSDVVSGSNKLEFSSQDDVLTIRKPDLPIAKDWKIDFKF